jgi:hypothetical protein
MIAFRRLALLALGVTLTACDDGSTSPPIDLAYIAMRFDALGRDRSQAGDPSGATAARGAALALRLGIRPTRVSIAVDGVTEEYLALETEHAFGDDDAAGPLPPPVIVVRTIIAWRGVRPDRFLAINVPGDTGSFTPPCAACLSEASNVVYWLCASGIMFERGGPSFIAVAGGARTTRQSIGGECEVPRRPSFIPALEPIACNRAVFFARFTMTAHEMSTTSRVLRSRVVQMGAHDVAGVRLQYGPLPTLCPVC